MQENHYFTMDNQRSSRAFENQQLQEQVEFRYSNYSFPNYVQLCNQCKSFKTILEVPKSQIPQQYTKRLSMLNRSNFTIKVKQIKKEEGLVHNNKIISKLLLYYEAVPFSMEYAKEGPLNIILHPARLEKSLRTIINELIESNVYNELSIANCGFGQNNEFKVYVPPSFVLRDRKLNNNQKQAMMNSAHLIVKYWQADLPKTMKPVNSNQVQRRSTFPKLPPSPPPPSTPNKRQLVFGEDTQRHKNSEQQAIDIKKTIKLSKNYVKQIHQRIQEQKQKNVGRIHELKKARSMEVLIHVEPDKDRKCSNFLEKINELNKKMMNIREIFIRKKSATDHKIKFGQTNFNKQVRNSQTLRQNIQEDVVFDKYEEILPPPKAKLNHHPTYPPILPPEEQLRESIDTYLQQMGEDDEIPRIKPNCEMRKTTLPPHLINENQHKNVNWNHESAGNMMFKRFIQKNKDKYPDIFEENLVSASGINAENRSKMGSEVQGVSKENRLKKMLSMDTFESKLETNSVHLSQYSNELSNVKRRKEKEDRNKQIKKKVADILIKSKKAIEMLRSPIKSSL